jgi:hypothetical protein
MNDDAAKKKREQRKRRENGIEQVSAFVNMRKFVAWLIWDGLLDEADCGDRNKITFALEAHLRAQYDLPDIPGEPAAKFAAGSFGAEATALRDQPTPNVVVGLLEREGQCEWRDPPTRFLITARKAALRRAAQPPSSDCVPATFPPGAFMFREDEFLEEEPAPPPDDYDPEEDVDEASADLSDETLADLLDEEGYDKD